MIAHNRGRLGKTLWTQAGDGDKIVVRALWDAEEEARWVGDEIEALQRKGHALSEIAILVRAGFQTREFEERFIALALPYRVIGGPRFYERQEIRDALAYLRLVNQPADDLAFERILNTPRRGIGSATLQQLHGLARDERLPLVEAARLAIAGDRLRPAGRNALAAFIAALDRWRGRGRPRLAHRPGADRARRIGLYRDVAGRPLARRRRPARKPEGAGGGDGRVREPRRLSRTCQPGHGQRRRRGRATWSI